jgi:hypothetical protein
MPKITHLRISNFRGIATIDIAVPPAGAIISGGNAQGKTSVLRAIAAALAGEGLGPEAIRLGADAAEILVDIDALKIRRGITAKGASLVVKNGDGDVWAKPQARLTELLGSSGLDALAFFEADAKTRRRMVLDAVPIFVTGEDIERWCGSHPIDAPAVDLHGLLVVEQLRKRYYDERTGANRAAKEAFEALARARADLPAAPAPCPMGVEDAGEALTAVETKRDEIAGRLSASESAKLRTSATRERIAALREVAAKARAGAMAMPTAAILDAAEKIRGEKEAAVLLLRQTLALAEAEETAATAECDRLCSEREAFARSLEVAEEKERQAVDLEQSIAAVAEMAPSPEEIAAAARAVEEADAVLKLAIDNAAHASHRAHIDELAAAHGRTQAAADSLDGIVKTLTEIAPRELAARAEMIPGLALTDDGLTLDGVALDALSGAEQLRFAVDLARRLNAKARILIVDGLERLDAGRLADFVRFATADGWQLLGTRVSEGELVVEAIEADAEAVA